MDNNKDMAQYMTQGGALGGRAVGGNQTSFTQNVDKKWQSLGNKTTLFQCSLHWNMEQRIRKRTNK